MIDNRWYTRAGKRKRISAEFEKLRPFAEEVKPHLIAGDPREVCAIAAKKFRLGLADRWHFTVAFFGLFGQVGIPHPHWAFSQENFDRGMTLIKRMEVR